MPEHSGQRIRLPTGYLNVRYANIEIQSISRAACFVLSAVFNLGNGEIEDVNTKNYNG